MKKFLSIVFITVVCLSLFTGCGKSRAVKDTIAAIDSIGEVTSDSIEAIENAEKLYNMLTDSEKEKVDNRFTLLDAREVYDSMHGEEIYNNAKLAYDKLNEVADLCIRGMDDIYGAWYFGVCEINDLDRNRYNTDDIYNVMAASTPHITSSELKEAVEYFDKTEGLMVMYMRSDWQNCVLLVSRIIAARGDYDTVQSKMTEAEEILQQLTKTYDDYTYYPKLKEYYVAVSSYVDFFVKPSGSFSQLADTINNYETDIRTYQSDIGFMFNE